MEREFKWQMADPADFSYIVQSDFVNALVQATGMIKMEAIYYDTADRQIANARGSLRLRRENEERVVCLKLSPREDFGGACKVREEYECSAQDIRSGIHDLPSAGAPQDICDALLHADLIEVGRTNFTRRTVQLACNSCTCELAFDIGCMTRGAHTAPICEMELELKSGSAEDFLALALVFQKDFSLTPQPLSKLARLLSL